MVVEGPALQDAVSLWHALCQYFGSSGMLHDAQGLQLRMIKQSQSRAAAVQACLTLRPGSTGYTHAGSETLMSLCILNSSSTTNVLAKHLPKYYSILQCC